MNDAEARASFPDVFFDEVDSGYTADIACCDACVSDFIALWPYAESARDYAFQRSSVSLKLFYENSRLSDIFTKEQFAEFSQDLVCPRCGNRLGPNMWPYNFPFNVDPRFEQNIVELAALAERTPFLILTHPFAKTTLSTLQGLASSLSPVPILGNLYRGRLATQAISGLLGEFDVPLPHMVEEGRYNHAGNPVLYLCSDAETCFEEMRRNSCVVAELDFDSRLKVLDLLKPEDSHPEFADALSALTYSALVSAPQPSSGWHKPKYVFSRFIADCARFSGIQAIRYPSTRITKENFNLVIIDPAFTLASAATARRYMRFPSCGQAGLSP